MREDDRDRRVIESVGQHREEGNSDDDGGKEERDRDECAHEFPTTKLES